MAKNRVKDLKRSSFFLKLLCMILIYPSNGREPDRTVITESDRQGLQALRHSLTDPKGFLKSWNGTGLGACSGLWAGIKCVRGQVIAIQLPWRGLGGHITEQLGQLPSLRRLSLHDNLIGGQIPPSIFLLPNLRGVHLFNNRFSGTIPPSIGNCLLLQSLDLSNNSLVGTIPALIFNSKRIYRLNLSYNNLSGTIPPPLANLSNLAFFNVSNNNLSGPVPRPLAQKFDPSSFGGNLQLCDYSPLAPCPSSRRKLNTRDVVLIAVGVVLAILLLLLCCVFLCCLVKRRSGEGGGEKPGPAAGPEVESAGGKLVHFDGPFVFTVDDLLCATAEIMGKSAYGTVYRTTLEDGNEVAVKRLREKIARGQREVEAEVNVLGKIRHENLLALRAYYLGPKGEKLLVFDYMPKGSLSAFLHGPKTPIDWPTRISIIVGTARGLDHLHNQMKMVHGNLTSSNILLDEHTSPKISDYGISRLMTPAANSSVIATASALGYRAPELSKVKKASTKTDVYSLGVVILELLTGKSPGERTSGADLPQWVASIVKEEWTNEVFDLELMKDAEGSVGDELLNTLKLALHCVDPSPSARPEVQNVLQQLEEIKPELVATASNDD